MPPSCELVVGGEPQCWSEGSCLLFDDSFLHRAFHEGEAWSQDRLYRAAFWTALNCLFSPAGASDDGPRVVFMVDLWHPNVAAAERQALDYIFTPARLEDKEGK